MKLALSVLVLFVGAALPPLAARHSRRLASWAAALPFASSLVLISLHIPALRAGVVAKARIAWVPELGLDFALRVDGLSLLFAQLVLGMGLLVVLYASYYLSAEDRLGRFFGTLLIFAGAMTGLVLSDNLLLIVVFWELTSVSSFLLIAYWSGQRAARHAAQVALSVTAAGGLCLLGGMLLLGRIAGSFELDAVLSAGPRIQAHPHFVPALVLILLGAFSKSAQMPLHFWLPRAMAAPTPVSAYLHSATMVKAGIFVLARLHPALAGHDAFVALVSTVGMVTMLGGAYAAFLQSDVKGLLAYSTISHLGLIVLLLGLGTEDAAIAAVFHILNHAIFKASLFMAAGIIDHETGTRDIRKLNGLFRHMPHTGLLAITAAAAMAGVPLFNGFLSKEMFFAEALRAELPWPGRLIVPAAAALAGAFGVTYSLRFVYGVFFRGDGSGLPKAPHEPPRWMRVPVELLAVLCLVIGIFPALTAQPLVSLAARAVVGHALPPYSIALWHGFNLPLAMTLVAMTAGVLLYLVLPRLTAVHRLLPRMSPARTFDDAIALLVSLSSRVTNALENGSLQRYGALLVGSAIAVSCVPFITRGVDLTDVQLSAPDLPSLALWFVAVVCTLGVTVLHRRRFVAVVLLSAVGSVIALAFVRLSAPDLALTQLLVEIVTIVVMLLALHHLPQQLTEKPGLGRKLLHLPLALASGVGMAALSFALSSRESESISEFFLARSLSEGGGRNVVNVILVDFRAFDTMGEVCVLAIAGLGVAVMLDGLDPRTVVHAAPRARDASPVLLRAVSQALLPLALVMSVFLFLRGHHLPGGGFIAALLAAIALLLQYLASGSEWTHRRLRRDFRPLLAAGLAIALATGLAAIAFDAPAFSMTFVHVHIPLLGDVELASALAFDLGVYLAVIGATVVILARLGELSRGAGANEQAFAKESNPWLP